MIGLFIDQKLTRPRHIPVCRPDWVPFDYFCYAKLQASCNFSSALRACKGLGAWLPITHGDHISVITTVLRQRSFWVWNNLTNGRCIAAADGVVSEHPCAKALDVLCATQFFEN